MNQASPRLHFLCGKIAAGKSTLAARLAEPKDAVLIVEDDWLKGLFADELKTMKDYARCSSKLRQSLTPHIEALIEAELTVVLDFAANTRGQRAWMKALTVDLGVAHALHWLDVSDELCLVRLHARNQAGTHQFVVSDAQFHQVSALFEPPSDDEGFDVIRHKAPHD